MIAQKWGEAGQLFVLARFAMGLHMTAMDKESVLRLIIKQLETNIDTAAQAVLLAHDTATHQDCLGSSKYETMGTEASYLAQGQGLRLLELERALAYFKQLKLPLCAKIQLSALTVLEDAQGKQQTLWLAGDAGGLKVEYAGKDITIITVKSPLGAVLLGQEEGDEVVFSMAGKQQCYQIMQVC